MGYFDHDFVSNSDLKSIVAKHDPKMAEPDNLQQIFDTGTLNHNALLEPYKADRNAVGYTTACRMAETVLKDDMCRKLILRPDFRREHEWYRNNMFGLKGVRCKTDGDSRELSTIFEYKGLAVNTENAFNNAILAHGYDASAYFYLNVVGYDNYLIVGVSKKKPELLFKRLVTRDHPYYRSGGIKIENSIRLWKQYGFV